MYVLRLCYLFFFLSFSVRAIEIVPPPNINKAEQDKFYKWKSYYLEEIKKANHGTFHKLDKLFVNELIYSDSPYLKQHAHNPINWKAWSEQLLKKAKKSNKLIFLSIGYSTCHWCHVMEKESFMDIGIASQLNKDFIAVKVDREELPNIDEYYTEILEQVKGSAGWPITVVIDGEGIPVYIDSYLGKQALNKLLTKISSVWGAQPNFLLSNGKLIQSMLKQRLVRDTASQSSSVLEDKFTQLDINVELLKSLDMDYGGFKGKVKFPNEAMLLYILDQLLRTPNPALEEVIKLQLDNMLAGGIYDHISGGFHRYVTEPTWTLPHFEKMLYTQAQLIEVYSQAYRIFREPRYKRAVQDTTKFLLDDFYLKGEGFASAMDADFKGVEGGFYLWKASELATIAGNKDLLNLYQGSVDINQDKLFGVRLPTIVLNEHIRQFNILKQELVNMRKIKGALRIDNKVLTGWNALAIKALVSSGELLSNQNYILQAEVIANKIWQERFNSSTGQLKRTSYASKRAPVEKENDALYLEDYVYYAAALLALYDTTGNSHWLDKAILITDKAEVLFTAKDGGYLNTINGVSALSLVRSKDTELISVSATMFNVILSINRRLGVSDFKRKHSKLIRFLKSRVLNEPLSHLSSALVLNRFELGKVQGKRYFASSNGKFTTHCRKSNLSLCEELEIYVELKEGWHINSNKPMQDYLIPTKLKLSEEFEVIYPKETVVSLGFQKEPLSVFEGEFKIIIKRRKTEGSRKIFQLPLQACSNSICLLPSQFKISI